MAELKPIASERGGLRLFTIFGIEIRLDFSVVIIFGLIVYSLAAGLFPQWHPEWAAAVTWGTAFAAGIMFFASLLAHELSHSLTARRFGIRVPRITLFLFGGVAEIESEAETPAAEFTIAIAGPLMSAALGLAFMFIVSVSLDEQTLAQILEAPETGIAGLNPVMTACIWLGSVNMMLAIFNLIPGFPLDGGRVFCTYGARDADSDTRRRQRHSRVSRRGVGQSRSRADILWPCGVGAGRYRARQV